MLLGQGVGAWWSLFLVRYPLVVKDDNLGIADSGRKAKLNYRKMVRKGGLGLWQLDCHKIKAAAVSTSPIQTYINVSSVVTVKKITPEFPPTTALIELQAHKVLILELASNSLNSGTGIEKPTIKAQAKLAGENSVEEIYEASFKVPSDFGEIGAVIIENKNREEKYVKAVVLNGFSTGSIALNCNSWVQPSTLPPTKRVFFTNKSYLPSQTPGGLRKLRNGELVKLRGDGKGVRKKFDRIYDYDVYNDLGNSNIESLKRPVLGGDERPYPRRCRTGRPHYLSDPDSEERLIGDIYVPRDESFSDVKQTSFEANKLLGILRTMLPFIEEKFGSKIDFPNLNAIDALYDVGGFELSSISSIPDIIPWVLKFFKETTQWILQFKPPEVMSKDKFSWLNDGEFARQTLAGLNPCSIQLVTEWPLTSKLDPDIYGPPESAISSAMVNEEIGGSITVEEAIRQKKVFMLDYHDLFLQYVEKVRDLDHTTLYGSRTLFFLEADETLRPLVIELTRPPIHRKPQWKRVFRPSAHGTSLWLWRFAKAHVLAHDSGYHQLISHWLRTHCAVEPYIIATNRQLSAFHPIFRLLHPHFRCTLEINSLARDSLINAGGVIEDSFSLKKYSMEFSSMVYDEKWQFDLQALPADLINRGMAVEDPTTTHGVKLIIKDYPFANDGLILWDALKEWVTEYVNHYYPDPYLVLNDEELQAWWTEIRTVGHEDKQDEPWWPVLNTPKDLIDIITNIVWVTSGHHAAVNFGQYAYAGYIPNRPSIARTNMPIEDSNPAVWEDFLNNPEEALLKCFPTQVQATTIMFVLELLSSHSPDEEYLGKKPEASWVENGEINKAFEKFSKKMNDLEKVIDHRNKDCRLKNRTGAGVMPYELLKPFSGPGVTGKGIPYSISI